MTKYIFYLLALILVLYGTANADFYKWEDENGTVHITDYPPQTKSGKKIQVHKYDSDLNQPDLKEDEQGGSKNNKQKAKSKPNVTLFTKDSCPECDKAREYLKSKKISFTEYNTDKDKKAIEKRKEFDDSTDVPFAIINRTQVFGFSEKVYDRALKPNPN
jgi:glutaredoxin